MNGDVRLLDKVAALGAALDNPALNASACHPDYDDAESAPTGATALIFCCSLLASDRLLSDPDEHSDCRSALRECAMS